MCGRRGNHVDFRLVPPSGQRILRLPNNKEEVLPKCRKQQDPPADLIRRPNATRTEASSTTKTHGSCRIAMPGQTTWSNLALIWGICSQEGAGVMRESGRRSCPGSGAPSALGAYLTGPLRLEHEFGQRIGLHLLHDPCAVDLDCLLTHSEFACNLFVQFSLYHQAKDL